MKKLTALVPVAAVVALAAAVAIAANGGPSTAADPAPGGAVFVVVSPYRLFDTRTGEGMPGGAAGKLAADSTTTLTVTGDQVPDEAVAVVMNVTYVDADFPGWVRVTPAGAGDTGTANLNKTFAGPEPNEVVSGLSDDGAIDVRNAKTATHLVGDVLGYYVPGAGAPGPKGDTGEQGPPGPAGPEGPPGPGADQFGTNTNPVNAGRGSECTLGELQLFAGVVGVGIPAEGQLLQIVDNTALYSLMGTQFGGDGRTTFGIPDMRPAAPNGTAYYLCDVGVYPSRN